MYYNPVLWRAGRGQSVVTFTCYLLSTGRRLPLMSILNALVIALVIILDTATK